MFAKLKIFSYRPGIRMIISLFCVLGIIGGSFFSIFYAMRALYDSTLNDASMILFLDLESRSHNISDYLDNFIRQARKREPLAEFSLGSQNDIIWLKGDFAAARRLSDLGLEGFEIDGQSPERFYSFGAYNGQVFYVDGRRRDSRAILQLFEINQADMGRLFTLNTKYTTIYLLSRGGMLLYTNVQDVTQDLVMKRPLVTSFIKMPFRQGQSEFEINGTKLYGFFQEIPRSNMIIFAEKTKQRAMEEVYSTIRRVAGVSVFYLVLAILILQVPLWMATRPIRALTDMAKQLSRGDFDVKINAQGFGELALLSQSFVNMADNLRNRDKTIAALHIDKLEKTKMEQGIRVASAIQDRFLFKPNSSTNSNLQIAAKYEPSLHLAGDWYGVHYDETRGETIISIVDITGHGIESAMMTPVMSVLFQEQKSRSDSKPFDIHEFMVRCNSALYAYGSGISTATGIIAKFNKGSGSVSWLNAGHPAPVIVRTDGTMIKTQGPAGSSTILGFSDELNMTEHTLELSSGTVFAIFSDGLMTAPVGGAVGFSRKDLFSALKTAKREDASRVMADLMDLWRKRNANIHIEDDMCIVLGLVK
jgi:serine phosphatase RsbU (regulator of sigma subunit)